MTNRVALGSARGGQGLYVSRPGYDVLSCDASYLMFSSDSGFLQLFQKGTVNAGANGVTSVTHTFGAYPYCLLLTTDGYSGWNYFTNGLFVQVFSDHIEIHNTLNYTQQVGYALMTFAT